jgi:hypothetical protein
MTFQAAPERGGAFLRIEVANDTLLVSWADSSSNFSVVYTYTYDCVALSFRNDVNGRGTVHMALECAHVHRYRGPTRTRAHAHMHLYCGVCMHMHMHMCAGCVVAPMCHHPPSSSECASRRPGFLQQTGPRGLRRPRHDQGFGNGATQRSSTARVRIRTATS